MTDAALPARLYTDPAVLEAEQDAIFGAAWQYVARADEVAAPGDYATGEAGRVPVVVVRDREGVLRAHVNVCRHRLHPVMEGAGTCTTLQCPYHAWTYDLDGTLRAAPRADREGLALDGLGLAPARVAQFGPFLFVRAADGGPSFADHLGDLPEVLAGCGLELGALEFERRTDWELGCNWKVAVENYLECYHCAVAHPGLTDLVDVRPDAYGLHERATFSFQTGPVRGGAGAFGGGPIPHAQWHWLWPNIAFNVEPGPPNLSIDVWRPDGPHRTVGRTDHFFGADVPAAIREEIMAFSAQVGEEDRALVEGVQRGLRSGAVEAGRLMPASERLVAHFQALVRAALSRAAPAGRSAPGPAARA